MKPFLTTCLLLGFLAVAHHGTSQCSPTAKTITTNPDAPVNPEANPNWQTTPGNTQFGRLNPLDWRAPYFDFYYNGMKQINGPFYQFNNPTLSEIDVLGRQEYKPEDGWEMVYYYNHLKDDLQTPLGGTSSANYPLIVLYNKFTAVLRVFGAIGAEQGVFNKIQVVLSVANTSAEVYKHPSLLDAVGVVGALRPMDQFVSTRAKDIKMATITSFAYDNSGYKWFFADFPMTYDPCTCDWLSNLLIRIFLINSMDISMTSTTTGKVQQIQELGPNADTTTAASQYSIDFDKLQSSGQEAWKQYGSLSKTISENKKIIDSLKIGKDPSGKKLKESYAKLAGILNSKGWDVLKKGLDFVPYAGAAVTLVTALVAGGKKEAPSATTQEAPPPMILQSTSTYEGTISGEYLFGSYQFWNPGSKHHPSQYVSSFPWGSPNYIPTIEELMRKYPLYNRTMGIINVVKTPEIQVYTSVDSSTIIYNLDGTTTYYCSTDQERYAALSPIEYVLNPEAELQIQEVYAALVTKSNPDIFFSEPSFWAKVGDTWQSRFIPLSTLIGMGFGNHIQGVSGAVTVGPNETFSCPYDLLPTVPQITQVKLMFNLKRVDNYAGPETQNVLWVGTYPVKTVATTTPIIAGPLSTPGILPDTTFTNKVISQSIRCWDTLRIGNGVTFANTFPITLQAGSCIEVSPTVEIPTNVTLLVEPIFPHLNVPSQMAYNSIRTYCQGTAYTAGRASNKTEEVNEEGNPIIAQGSLPLTAQPNPFSETLSLHFGPEAGTLTVYDVLGRAISSSELAADQQQLDLSTAAWQPGVYITVLQTASGRQAVRVMKQ